MTGEILWCVLMGVVLVWAAEGLSFVVRVVAAAAGCVFSSALAVTADLLTLVNSFDSSIGLAASLRSFFSASPPVALGVAKLSG